MPLVSGAEVVLGAAKDGRGVGAFNVIQLEHATALIAGAEQLGAPVILQISENAVKYHGSLKPIGVATLAAAAAATVPVVVHLDHAMDRDLVTEAVSLGFTSVMYDASKLDYADNVAATTEVTNFATTTAFSSRPRSAKSVARTVCTPPEPGPSRRRPWPSPRPPGSTRWPSRSVRPTR